MEKCTQVLIIGSGVAALQLAKNLRPDVNVTILTKSNVLHGNSALAQGGVAAALAENDDPYKHFKDTIIAGSYHNDEEAVLQMTKAAPSLIRELFQEGCSFDVDSGGNLCLGMEGAHSEKRIVHGGGDATGKRIMDFLYESVKARDSVTILENMTVFELMVDGNKCIGAKAKHPDGTVVRIYSEHTVLATGGGGQLYSFTPCAETATGDGIALAYRAGAEISDMEFIQFHPTLLYVEGKGRGLISEAVRGEGAVLVSEDGTKIMEGVHPLKDLAPRHVVAQTIYDYLKRGLKVYLDIGRIDNFEERFPTITAMCGEHHIDFSKGMIPVVPGCHFFMGGVKTDLYGRTNIEGLYAIGEVARTGIHGANRLASNSLLEGLFFGKKLAGLINSLCGKKAAIPSFRQRERKVSPVETLQLPDVRELKENMMSRVGIVRTETGLKEQKQWLESFSIEKWLEAELDHLSPGQIERVFMLITSWLITVSALERTESRGGHFRSDYPFADDSRWLKKEIIHKRTGAKDGRYEQIKTAQTP